MFPCFFCIGSTLLYRGLNMSPCTCVPDESSLCVSGTWSSVSVRRRRCQ